jgi:thioredoxin 1
MALETSDASFKSDVLDSPLPVLVDFWAPWCGPCRMMGPILEALGKKAGDRAKLFKLNVDENRETAGRYAISAIPTVIIFRNGKAEKEFVGVQSEKVYLDALGM